MQHLKKNNQMTDYQKYKLIILSVFSALFLIILYNYSGNGRYVTHERTTRILDTRTGTVYAEGKKLYEI